MDSMNEIVARNIKSLREKNRLSMEELAKLSGVSKSMLAQIERGEGNPTVTTLWKISNGMKVPFDALTYRLKTNSEVIRIRDIAPVLEDSGKVRNYPIFPDDESRQFAVYFVEVDPGAYWSSEPHLVGTSEFLTVISGEMTIRFDEEERTIHPQESLRFKSDVAHAYHNSGCEKATLHMVIYNL